MPIATTVITVMVVVAIVAVVHVSAHTWRAAAADVADRTPVAGQNIVLVYSQILRSIPLENIGDASHGAKAAA